MILVSFRRTGGAIQVLVTVPRRRADAGGATLDVGADHAAMFPPRCAPPGGEGGRPVPDGATPAPLLPPCDEGGGPLHPAAAGSTPSLFYYVMLRF